MLRITFKPIPIALLAVTLSLASRSRADLVGHWTFDENAGLTAADSTGNGFTGALMAAPGGAAPTWVSSGIYGNALNFAGNGYVELTNTASAYNFGASGFTLSAWARFNVLSPAIDSMIVDKHLGGGANGYFLSTVPSGHGNFFFQNDATRIFSPSAYNDGEWHLFTGTNDGVTGRLYIDGQLIGLNSGVPINNSENMRVGGLFLGGGSFVGGFLGAIDDVRVYNTALSSSDVNKLFQNTLGANAPEPGSLALIASGGVGLLAVVRRRARR